MTSFPQNEAKDLGYFGNFIPKRKEEQAGGGKPDETMEMSW